MYEQSTSVVVNALSNSSATVFDEGTIQRILSLTTQGSTDTTVSFDEVVATGGQVNASAGAEVVFVGSSATETTTLTAPKGAPVVIFQGLGGVNATFNDGPTTVQSGAGVVERVIIGSAGADKIIISDSKNSQITIGAGDTVVAGAGNDTIVAGTGNSTVVGGTGHAIVQLGGNDADYVVTVVNGHAVVTNGSTGVTTDISKIQYVQLDDGEALVFANNTVEAAVTTLYQTAFGRTADANGLQFWFDAAANGMSLHNIAAAFEASNEFKVEAPAGQDAFVTNLYQNTFGRAADSAGLAYWTNALENGVVDRADLIEQFSYIAAQHIAGTLDGEATIIGSVTIIPGVIG
jgi:hypothetical protein